MRADLCESRTQHGQSCSKACAMGQCWSRCGVPDMSPGWHVCPVEHLPYVPAAECSRGCMTARCPCAVAARNLDRTSAARTARIASAACAPFPLALSEPRRSSAAHFPKPRSCGHRAATRSEPYLTTQLSWSVRRARSQLRRVATELWFCWTQWRNCALHTSTPSRRPLDAGSAQHCLHARLRRSSCRRIPR